jgi:hypothetical protein
MLTSRNGTRVVAAVRLVWMQRVVLRLKLVPHSTLVLVALSDRLEETILEVGVIPYVVVDTTVEVGV